MKTITLCEGILGYFTFEIYTISQEKDGIVGYHLSWAQTHNSGLAIGRGYDFGAQGDMFKAKYLFKNLLKMGNADDKEIMVWQILNDTRIHQVVGADADILLKEYNNNKKNIFINTEQAFALFHASWSNSKKEAIFDKFLKKEKKFSDGKFSKIFETIYPPLREILISMTHSSSGGKHFSALVDTINNELFFLNSYQPKLQCKKMVEIFFKEITENETEDRIKKRHISRLVYAELLKNILEEGKEIIWVPLADVYLIDFTAEELGESTDKEMASKEVAKQFLLGLKDFPWKNYSNGYNISLSNFNLMLKDKQNKTIEIASSVRVYTEIFEKEGAKILTDKKYTFLEHKQYDGDTSSYNIQRLITTLAIKRELKKHEQKLKDYKNLQIINLGDNGHGAWDNTVENLWKAYQEKNVNHTSSYPDVLTISQLLGFKGITHANTFGKDKINEVPQKLISHNSDTSYKLSENWNVLLDFSDINYLREILQNPSKKGDIKGSVGYRSDNYFRDVVVIRILLARKKGKDVFLMEQLTGAFSQLMWRLKLTTDAAPKDVILVVCDTLMEEQIKDFQRTVLGITKPNGYITPDSIELKKLNGE